MKLYLLRHGATPGNLKKQYIGSTNQPLAEEGIRQAMERSQSVPPVEKVWVSTMLRARQTAELFYPSAPKKYMDSLIEMDFGTCEQKTWEEINDPTIYDGWLAHDLTAAFPEGETLGALLERTTLALREIGEDVKRLGITSGSIVAHGGVLMALMDQHGIPKRDFFSWESANCGGFEVEFDADSLSLTYISQIGGGRIW